jgi:FG-GAP-like repeat
VHSRRRIVIFALVVCAAAWAFTQFSISADTQTPGGAVRTDTPATEADARALCGTACHRYPPPDILPRSEWREEIAKMTLFSQGNPVPPGPPGTLSRMVALPPDMERVLRFYTAHAPAELPAPEAWPAIESASKLVFERRAFAPERASKTPSVSNVRFADIDRDGKLEIVVTEMSYGYVMVGRPSDPQAKLLDIVADIPHPSHSAPFDLDKDGRDDLLVANLGSFLPGDHQHGGVAWLRRMDDGRYGVFELTGFPRVADVEAGDFNGDGKPDLLVGAFGWRSTGFIGLLTNHTTDYSQPSFETTRLDDRSGTINVIPTDLNKDGRLDFVALISQQHEAVVAYLNNRAGGFAQETIYTAPHPNWGSSGMQLVDFDGDGDLDVLVTNGDSFDDFLLKPYHGIQWLENEGRYPYTAHPLASLAGTHRAVAVDLDADGDLDVVAATMIALAREGVERTLPSVVWLERIGPKEFKRHTLEVGTPSHASLDAADYDGDGDIDLVIGNLSPQRPVPTWVEVWENRTPRR